MPRPVLQLDINFATPAKEKVRMLSTGCTVLDCALGGGYPLGRIVNIVGDKSTAKTGLAVEAAANFATMYPQGTIDYVETEAAFDTNYARQIGLPVDRVNFIHGVDTVEDFFETLDGMLVKRKAREGLLVLDSLDALSDRSEVARKIDESSFGAAKAKKMSELFRRLVQKIEKSYMLVLLISQVRDNIGVTFGKKYTRSGGRALDFYASQIIYLAHVKTIKRTVNKIERPVAVFIKARVEKNKVAPPFREVEFPYKFGFGIDDVTACATFLDGANALGDIEYFNSGRSMTARLLQLDKEDDATYKKVHRQLRNETRRAWQAIEDSFAPSRKKYT